MKIVYTGDSPSVETPEGRVFPHGEAVTVPDALGKSLLERPDFEAPTGKEGK